MTKTHNSDLGKVAVIGLGQMGSGIARNLLANGLLGGVWDISSQATAVSDLGDRVPVKPVSELVETCRILLFAVPTTGDIRKILQGVPLSPERIIIDVTTSSPDESRNLAEALEGQGVGFVDAAMTGGAAGADTGSLTLMMGGAPQDIADCKPAFDAIAAQVFHLGPVGSGHAMKLVHNMILHSSFLATCEGLRLAERAGLDPSLVVDVLNAGNARSFVTETRFPRDILSGTMQARSTISNLEKDLRLAKAFGTGLDAEAPFARLSSALLSDAAAGGRGNLDFSHLYPLFDAFAAKSGPN